LATLAILVAQRTLATVTLVAPRRPALTGSALPAVRFLAAFLLEILALMLVRMATTCAEPRPQSGT
jgi:hypothetical protein